MKAPMYHNGKQLRYEEIFHSPFSRPTQESDQEILDSIRAVHNSAYVWVELDAQIEEI